MRTTCALFSLVGVLGLSADVFAQDAPKYQNLRFNEDWSQMPEEGYGDFFDPIKHIELSDSATLSVGGHTRLRFESWSNFGFAPLNDDEFLMNQTFIHTDWHFGERLRVFVEGKTATLTDRDLPGGKRSALDEDEADIWNAFVEGNFELGGLSLMLRGGRQEMQFGRQRLISPLAWSNNRRIFDGVRITLKDPDKTWTLDGFYTSPVTLRRHHLNKPDQDKTFVGVYYKRKLNDKQNGEAYYLLLDQDDLQKGIDSDRHTIGGHVSGGLPHDLSFDVESAYQFGDANGSDIGAWMVVTELTFKPKEVSMSPWGTVGFDYASGDDDPADTDVGTFNQLFPLGHAYNGFIDIIGRQNIIDVHGTVGFWPIEKKVSVKTDYHLFRLAEDTDALYHAGGGVVRAGGVNESDVGSEVDLTLTYKHDRHTTFWVGYSHFFAGQFIEDTGSSSDIDFIYTQAKYAF